MLAPSMTAVIVRNELWSGVMASEPYEVGWAREAVIFVRCLKAGQGEIPEARVQISADGLVWADEGTGVRLPDTPDTVSFARVSHFGGWLRLYAALPEDAGTTLLVTLHLK